MEFTLNLTGTPFNLEYTLSSGQAFRWENRGDWWYGVVEAGVMKVRQEGETLACSTSSELLDSSFTRGYFSLEDDFGEVFASMRRDETMARAVQEFYGMRIMRQDRWECLASFVLATNSNIPSITRMVNNVCQRLGDAFQFEGRTYNAFPTPERVAEAPEETLDGCGLGYRAQFLRKVAKSVYSGRIDFSEVAMLDYVEARRSLISRLLGEKLLLGVGPKVADCVLLFSLGKDEAFPIDVWVARALARYYPELLSDRMKARLASGKKATISAGEYEKISAAARGRFGPFAGYAQQYLFMLARSEKL